MLSRIVKLLEARRALRQGRLHDALALAGDEAIREHRRAQEIRSEARERLLARARERRDRGELSGALIDVRSFLGEASPDDRRGRELFKSLRSELTRRDELRALQRSALKEARRLLERGWAPEARSRLLACAEGGAAVEELRAEIERRIRETDALVDGATAALARGEIEEARRLRDRLRERSAGHAALDRLDREILRARLAGPLDRIERAATDEESALLGWEALDQRFREELATVELPELEAARARLRERLCVRVREALRDGEAQRARSLAERLQEVLGPGLEPELAGGLDALADAADLRDLGAPRAAVVRLARAGGSREVEVALLYASRAHEELAARVEGFTAAFERAALAQDWNEARRAVAHRVEELPTDRAGSALLQALEGTGGETTAPAEHAPLAGIAAAARGEDGAAAGVETWIAALRRGRETLAAVIEQLARGHLQGAELERARERVEASLEIARDDPWLLAAAHLVAFGSERECEHRALQDAIGRGDWSAALAALRSARTALRETEGALRRLATRARRRDLEALDAAWRDRASRGAWRELAACLEEATAEDPELHSLLERWRNRLRAEKRKLHAVLDRWLVSEERVPAEWLARAKELLPSHPVLARKLSTNGEADRLDARLERIEEMADRNDYSGAWDELRGIEEAGPFRTRIFDLQRRVQRERGLGQRFFLRIEEGGEFLVLTSDRVQIGNARAAGNDLPVLANISSHHAVIERSLGFHEGLRFTVRPLGERPVHVEGEVVGAEGRVLRPGDRMLLGSRLEIAFEQSGGPGSQAALLRFREGFDVQGVERVLLLRPGGRAGRVVLGSDEAASLRVARGGPVELWMDAEGQLRARASVPLRIDGHAVEAAEPILHAGAWVEAGALRFAVDPG